MDASRSSSLSRQRSQSEPAEPQILTAPQQMDSGESFSLSELLLYSISTATSPGNSRALIVRQSSSFDNGLRSPALVAVHFLSETSVNPSLSSTGYITPIEAQDISLASVERILVSLPSAPNILNLLSARDTGVNSRTATIPIWNLAVAGSRSLPWIDATQLNNDGHSSTSMRVVFTEDIEPHSESIPHPTSCLQKSQLSSHSFRERSFLSATSSSGVSSNPLPNPSVYINPPSNTDITASPFQSMPDLAWVSSSQDNTRRSSLSSWPSRKSNSLSLQDIAAVGHYAQALTPTTIISQSSQGFDDLVGEPTSSSSSNTSPSSSATSIEQTDLGVTTNGNLQLDNRNGE